MLPVKCESCGTLVRRVIDAGNRDLELIYTRVLVKDQFVPACSEHCARRLRGMIDLDKYVRLHAPQ